MDSEQSQTIGRYVIIKHLAHGGMAQVLVARSNGLEGFERHVVIKRISAAQASDQRFVKMFLDEARLAASLHHHNIVQVHDIGEDNGDYFFAMEYIHGENIRSLLARASERGEHIPLAHVLTIASNVAAGLHYAHEHHGPDRKPLGIVHRDVSPANILVGYDGSVKVVDFGIAKATLASQGTNTGTLRGNAPYMSPEQCVGKTLDRRSDVFSLGVVLFELATTRRLFKADNDFMIMSTIVEGKIPRPTTYRPDLPRGLEDIIMNALARDPKNRPATARDLQLALEDFADRSEMRMSNSGLATYLRQQFGSRPEPWLVDGTEPPSPPEIDFDKLATGSGKKVEVQDITKVNPTRPASSPAIRPASSPRLSAALAAPVPTPSPLARRSAPAIPIPKPDPKQVIPDEVDTSPGSLRSALDSADTNPAVKPVRPVDADELKTDPVRPKPAAEEIAPPVIEAADTIAMTPDSIAAISEDSSEGVTAVTDMTALDDSPEAVTTVANVSIDLPSDATINTPIDVPASRSTRGWFMVGAVALVAAAVAVILAVRGRTDDADAAAHDPIAQPPPVVADHPASAPVIEPDAAPAPVVAPKTTPVVAPEVPVQPPPPPPEPKPVSKPVSKPIVRPVVRPVPVVPKKPKPPANDDLDSPFPH